MTKTEPADFGDTPSAAYNREPVSRAAWYGLFVLFLVYCVSFIDRQILSILAEEIKADLGLADQDMGFLYGTAFGVFYALFGIPLGRLADNWNRVRLLALGLVLWSAMTTLSGLARNGATLTAGRVGVGVGEACANPCAYSLISDWFPERRRGTALAIYSSGLFLGSGLSLFIGGLIVENWNNVFPEGGPFGLTGWRAAFIAVGLPGLILAFMVSTLREPVRGGSTATESDAARKPFRTLLDDLFAIVPPFTLVDAARRGVGVFFVNLAVLASIAMAVHLLMLAGEPAAQWVAVGCGAYAVASWGMSLRHRDRATFEQILANPAMLLVTLAYSSIAFLNYALIFWTAPYAIRVLGGDPSTVGLLVGGTGAVAGFVGVTLGGLASDWLVQRTPRGRVLVVLFGAIAPAPFVILAFGSSSLAELCIAAFLANACAATALSAGGATVQDLALPRTRGTAIAVFSLGATLLGLGVGPYLAGRISTITGDLGFAMQCLTLSCPVALVAGLLAYRALPAAMAKRNSLLQTGV